MQAFCRPAIAVGRSSVCKEEGYLCTLGLEAEVTMPGILTSRDTCSDCASRRPPGSHAELQHC
jgi:hypothetical protein